MNPTVKQLLVFSLQQQYKQTVRKRVGRSAQVPGPSKTLIEGVAERLGDHRLSRLFMEAQFSALTKDWCMEIFKRPYPPANVVFGGECWRRYEEYKERGRREPI